MLTPRVVVAATLCLLPLVLAAQPSVPPPPPPPPSLWHFPGAAVGTPTHDTDTVYALDKERHVMALSADDGHLRWRTGTGVTSSDAIFGMTTSGTNLVLAGNLVIAGDWDIVAFDRRSGARRWTYQAAGGDGPGLFLGAARDDTVYAGSVTGRVYAVDAGSGRLRWLTRLSERPMVSVFAPEVAGPRVVVGYSVYDNPNSGGVAALDAASGRILWNAPFPRPSEPWRHVNRTGGPVIDQDLVFASAGDGNVYAFDLDSGAMRWTLPRLEGPFAGYITATDLDHRTLVKAGRLIVAGSATGKIVAYDIDRRTLAWEHDAGPWGSTGFSMAADDAFVYVPFFGGFVMALEASTGQERWRVGDFNIGMIWAPDPAGDRVFAAGSRGGVYAFERQAPPPALRSRP